MSENGWMGIEFLDSQIEMPTVIHEFGQSAVDDENWGSCWVTFPEGEK